MGGKVVAAFKLFWGMQILECHSMREHAVLRACDAEVLMLIIPILQAKSWRGVKGFRMRI
jgi:hypothetical protein